MKIGIDARILINVSNCGGIGRYLSNLIFHLARIDRENEYFLFFNFFKPKYEASVKNFLTDNFRERSCRIPHQIMDKMFDWFHLPIETMLGEVDVLHGPDFVLLPQRRGKAVVTIHDLMYLNYPQLYGPRWNKFYEKAVSRALKRADIIIVVSEFVKDDVMKKLNQPERKIRVVHNGIEQYFSPVRDKSRVEKIRAEYGIDRPYILHVGLLEPQKNLLRLIEAFSSFLHSTSKRYNLVLAGGGSYEFYRCQLEDKARELNLEKEVIFTGFVSDEDLPALYSGAEMFVFPSLFEGFGMPPLEAMACGTPVISSKAASLPEVVGEAAVKIDPFSVGEIAEAMSSIVDNGELRDSLLRNGFERSKLFTWENTARKTLRIYEELGT